MSKRENPKRPFEERYIKLRYKVLDKEGLELGAKVLYEYIHGFGKRGCFQDNEQIADKIKCSGRSISRWVGKLKKLKALLYIFPNSPERVLWAKKHPDVLRAKTLPYRQQELDKGDIIVGKYLKAKHRQNGEVHGQNVRRITPNCPCDIDKNGVVTTPECLSTNKGTKIITKGNDNAMPSPLPAGGQAPALLKDQKTQVFEPVEQFKRGFGYGGRRASNHTPEQKEQQKKQQIKALRASEKK